MRDFLHRLYPYQALKLMFQRVRLIVVKPNTPIGHSPPLCQDSQPFDPDWARSQLVTLFRALKHTCKEHGHTNHGRLGSIRRSILHQQLGFHLEIGPSRIQNAGLGVFLRGHRIIRPGSIVAMYPGTLYRPGEAIFFNSIQNRYILKCNDGVYVDGKAKGLSGSIFRSANGRDNYPGITPTADTTWMMDWNFQHSKKAAVSGQEVPGVTRIGSVLLKNPLAVGQIVNNGTKLFPPNVRYQELDIRARECPLDLQEFLPNIWSSGDWHVHDHDHDSEAMEDVPVDWSEHSRNYLRTVILITTKHIEEDEELYSTYIEENSFM
ncbi:SET domain-containing protein 9 [Modicella reniformis]|uniref:SET domain-containing protein 9 n=1 Tax=Modicella reniformis TaxID=1440133 RepID=A0A9P6SPE7_9FUNG|nr:SET domain-containing protein 9 [Modicella reniformis]